MDESPLRIFLSLASAVSLVAKLEVVIACSYTRTGTAMEKNETNLEVLAHWADVYLALAVRTGRWAWLSTLPYFCFFGPRTETSKEIPPNWLPNTTAMVRTAR